MDRATIGGDLNCYRGKVVNPGGAALSANGVKVGGAVVLTELEAEGAVWLVGASICGSLACDRGQFINTIEPENNEEDSSALIADDLKVEGSAFFRNAVAKGGIRLLGATIGGNLDCSKGHFSNEKAQALSADGVKVEGAVFLKGLKADGEVRLRGAMIGTNLECDDGYFSNESGYALIADYIEVRRNVFLRNGFMAKGGVILQGARIRGKLDCTTGHFSAEDKEDNEDEKRYALFANNLTVEGPVFFRKGFTVKGEVSLLHAIVKGMFYWTDITSTEGVKLDLRYARIGTIRDEEKSWPAKGQLYLHGLIYDQIHNVKEVPRDAKRRIDWIQRQYDDKVEEAKAQFWPQPYEQLASVLRNSGDDAAAKKVLIAKYRDKLRFARLMWYQKLWLYLLGLLAAYGYHPIQALAWVGGLCVLGSLFFCAAGHTGVMTPVRESAYVADESEAGRHVSPDYPTFSPILYSMDVCIPLVDLHQRNYWQPNVNKEGWISLSEERGLPIKGSYVRGWLIFETLGGWVLMSILIFSLTRMVRT